MGYEYKNEVALRVRRDCILFLFMCFGQVCLLITCFISLF